MRGRLASIIGPTAYRVPVTTFHSFCNDLIQQYPETFQMLAGAVPMAETDQLALIEKLITQSDGLELLRPQGAPLLYLKPISHTIDTLKREDVSPDRLQEIAAQQESALMSSEDLYHDKGRYKGQMKGVYADQLKQTAKLRELAQLYRQYQDELRLQKLYDYNDMISEVARALDRDEQFRLMLQEGYQYVLVDEHQDTNNAQNHIIEQLASFWERPNLSVVGDARQAIYRFQGASLENFLYFKTLYADVRLIELQDNYRSNQTILDAATTGLKARADHQECPIGLLTLNDPDTERFAVASHIREQIAAGTQPQEIAVLYRDNADGQALAP
jgi:DNA helicase-2/ATP-dependent DNA helicase PcrA